MKIFKCFQGFEMFVFRNSPNEYMFGWWTGKDNDEMCVRPNLIDPWLSHTALSPLSTNPILSIIGFTLKFFLLFIDQTFLFLYDDEQQGKL